MNLRDVAIVAVRHRSYRYWHREGVVEAALAAAEAVRQLGLEVIIDALEREIKNREFICDFNDPCDEWVV